MIAVGAVAGAACAPDGSVAVDSAGLFLSCQSGKWRASGINWVTFAVQPGGWYALTDPVTGHIYSQCISNSPVAVPVVQYPTGTLLNYYNYFNWAFAGTLPAPSPTWAYYNSSTWQPLVISCVY